MKGLVKMAKVESMSIKEFMNRGKTNVVVSSGDPNPPKIRTFTKAALPVMVLLPKTAFAAGIDGTFGNVHGAIMNAFDAGVVLVIIFSGAAWGLGNRSQAIEILIGVCCGYILARHAVDVRDFLKGI